MERIIKLNNDYGISVDDMNIVLHKARIAEKGKNAGTVQYTAIGYYSSIESLLRGLVNKQVLVSVKDQESLEAVAKSVDVYIDKLYEDLHTVVKELRK